MTALRTVLISSVCLLVSLTTLSAQNPNYVLTLTDDTVVGGTPATSRILITNTGGDIQGFSLGVCHDPAALQVAGIAFGAVLQAMNDGSGPDFFSFTIFPDGLSCGTVFSFSSMEFIFPGADQEAVIMDYDTASSPPTITEVCFCDGLGQPPVQTIVVVSGASLVPVQNCGTIELIAGADFVRGDPNSNGAVDIADPIYVLNYLFLDGPAICLSAMDANGDQSIDLADGLYLLNYINGNGPVPVAPFPECGSEQPDSPLYCQEYTACP